MKKTRGLAALLCMMMVCTMIPILASATGTTYSMSFTPGTDWVEYAVKTNANSGYDVYVKAASTSDLD